MTRKSLLPIRTSVEVDPEPTIIEFTEADAVFKVVASETTRNILQSVYETPAPSSHIADEIGTSLQNAGFHLHQPEEAGLVEIIDTWYSSKGIEMDVYGPRNTPLVIRAGNDRSDDTTN